MTQGRSRSPLSRRNSDEAYVIDLCDQVLGLTAERQKRLPFLKGDPGKSGRCALLPVDAFYSDLALVVEYCEEQHTRSVDHFDKPWKLTVSGVHRGVQRKIYDQRRRDVLPQHGLTLVEIPCISLAHNTRKRLMRRPAEDLLAIRTALEQAGVLFQEDGETTSGGPGVRLRKRP